MPIYEYQCESCDERCEFMQKVSDPPASECPHCHASQLKRLISAVGFRLKGSGWYVTDFKDKGKKPTKKEESPANQPKADKPKTDEKK